ncbi:MAG: hypothetical protein VX278_19090 [Myxococcota bacterium]|nr:hypothetical protein [Myxococcota bacterium]
MLLFLCASTWADDFQSHAIIQYHRLAPFTLSDVQSNEQEQWLSGSISFQYRHQQNQSINWDFGVEVTNHLLQGDAYSVEGEFLQPIHRSEFQIWPNKVRVSYERPHLRLSLGTQQFNWGLGLFYSDRSLPSWFGNSTWNDTYAGFGVAYSPLPIASKKVQITLFSTAYWILRNEFLSIYQREGGATLLNGVLVSLPYGKAGLLFAPDWKEGEWGYPIDAYVQLKLMEKLFLEGEYLYRLSWIESNLRSSHGGALRLKAQNGSLGYGLELGRFHSNTNFRKHRNNPVGLLYLTQYVPRKILHNNPSSTQQSSISNGHYAQGMLQFQSQKSALRVGYVFAKEDAIEEEGHELDMAALFLLTPQFRITAEGALLLPLEAWYAGLRCEFQIQQRKKTNTKPPERPPW